MNFTHLVNADDVQPDQLVLQRYDYFLILFVLSDVDADFALSTVGTRLRAASTTLCWIVQPKHLRIARSGTALGDIYTKLKERAIISADHSFIAWIAKRDLLAQTGGEYRPLFLGTQKDPEKTIVLKESVEAALRQIEGKAPTILPAWLSNLPTVARVASQLFGNPVA